MIFCLSSFLFFFFFNDTATTEIYTLSLHDALPICGWSGPCTVSGNQCTVSMTTSTTVAASFSLDTPPPTGTIAINNGAAATSTASVTLNLTCSDGTGSGCSQMQFSNDNVTWSAWQTVSATASWTLTAGDGTKTVYAKFKDVAGNISSLTTGTILLDSVAPTGTVAINNGAAATSAASVTLNLT